MGYDGQSLIIVCASVVESPHFLDRSQILNQGTELLREKSRHLGKLSEKLIPIFILENLTGSEIWSNIFSRIQFALKRPGSLKSYPGFGSGSKTLVCTNSKVLQCTVQFRGVTIVEQIFKMCPRIFISINAFDFLKYLKISFKTLVY